MTSSTKQPRKKASAARDGHEEIAREAWTLIYDLFMSHRPHFIAVCREYELFPPQVMVLRSLEQPKPMREIAQTLACDSSNVTGIIDRLEERGLVRRTAAEKDRRVKLLVLTGEGERMRKAIVARLTSPPPELTALSRTDLNGLKAVLGRARDAQP